MDYTGKGGHLSPVRIDRCPVLHYTVMVTQRYAHHYPESLRDGVETLDRIGTLLAQSNKKEATAFAVTS